ncbi:MAG: SH3 domain-containing protein [Planctomycetota bacterium]
MRSRIILASIIFAVVLTSNIFAEEKEQTTVNKTETKFPYTAEITANNVNIRSGPGTAYYPCGKLDKGNKVRIISAQFNWSRIIPPPGSFSWISKQYVKVSPADPNTGIITGNNVRIYVGSKERKAIQSETLQTKRNKGETVKLLGEEEDGLCKIQPPSGAYLWVKTVYTKIVSDLPKPVIVKPTVIPTVTPTTSKAPVTKEKILTEEEKLKEYKG